MGSSINVEAIPPGGLSGRETALLLYGALDAIRPFLESKQRGAVRVLEIAGRSLWPVEAAVAP